MHGVVGHARRASIVDVRARSGHHRVESAHGAHRVGDNQIV